MWTTLSGDLDDAFTRSTAAVAREESRLSMKILAPRVATVRAKIRPVSEVLPVIAIVLVERSSGSVFSHSVNH